MSFWYGLSFDEISDMPIASIEAYAERLPQRLAEMKIYFGETTMLPHIKDSERKKMLARWQRDQKGKKRARKASPAILKQMGIQVTYVK